MARLLDTENRGAAAAKVHPQLKAARYCCPLLPLLSHRCNSSTTSITAGYPQDTQKVILLDGRLIPDFPSNIT
jgi:hypothetical protein